MSAPLPLYKCPMGINYHPHSVCAISPVKYNMLSFAGMNKLGFDLLVFCLVCALLCDVETNQEQIGLYRIEVEEWLQEVDVDLGKFNLLAALFTWTLSTHPDDQTAARAMSLMMARSQWKNRICEFPVKKERLTEVEERKLYLLCRGPKFTDELSRSYLEVMGQMAAIYNTVLCLTQNDTKEFNSYSPNPRELFQPEECLHGEPDLERLMKNQQLNAAQLKWIWLKWHNFIGPRLREVYPYAVRLQNVAAQNSGILSEGRRYMLKIYHEGILLVDYNDMGEVWREELEMPNLEQEVLKLYEEIKPLYVLLHAVTRHKLLLKYGSEEIDATGPIPIHLLGNMWGQDWSSLINLFVPKEEMLDLDKNILRKNWTVVDMVLQAEDMYTSFGLPKMTDKFWKNSIFEENNGSMCHGTAANLFNKDDYRMLLCAKINMEDFYVIHHEMGHIEYYMAYKDQPAIFQDGANSAFHESIGDAIMNGVMVPQHLHRLGIIADKDLYDPNFACFLLLHQALSKIPEISFSLVVDAFRWKVFNGLITPDKYNEIYWKMSKYFRGIAPPEKRTEAFFDIGGKFHIADNTPYIRYFLSSILHLEMFESMCQLSMYGRVFNDGEFLPFPLHKCDIYGSRKVGKLLMEMMSKGASQHWTKTLKILTGKDYLTTKPLLNYYKPLFNWLKTYVERYKIPVGW